MKLSAFKFELPEKYIALHPAQNRDESRLMVINRQDQSIEHARHKDEIDQVQERDISHAIEALTVWI